MSQKLSPPIKKTGNEKRADFGDALDSCSVKGEKALEKSL
jgi:hypothetical protein